MAVAELRHAEAVTALEKQLCTQKAELEVLSSKSQDLARLQSWANEVLAPLGHKLQAAEEELAAVQEDKEELQIRQEEVSSENMPCAH